MNLTPEKNIFTVSQLNRKAKLLLETHLPLIWVSGEISNLAKPASGHWYFSLKDSQAQVRCAMFRNANQRVRFAVESGQQVLIRARVSLYEGRGEYQLIAEHIEPAGAGALQQEYERLKAALSAEGLFATENKKALPAFPQEIVVITSPTGAAIHDILSVLKRRYPVAKVTVIPVSVQGESAAPEMITALRKTEQLPACDVVIIGRGGGSIEDLWAFNNEALVRAIAAFPIPIVSAVGHEVDFTLTDFVADHRAPTPSASAEMVSPDSNEWLQRLDRYLQTFTSLFSKKLADKRSQVSLLKQGLRHPQERINSQKNQLSHLSEKLHLGMSKKITEAMHQLTTLQLRVEKINPKIQLDNHKQSLAYLYVRLQQSQRAILENKKQRFLQQTSTLHAISPLNVLARGYSITATIEGKIIKEASKVIAGDTIKSTVGSGTIISQVVEHQPQKK